ncbi:hypothetical protein [Caenibacillus caldisaponilyticus]|uniref:hypothetical protein n=1 Tax=Caenibacillus caldisaponilyticus TaxID=1674942 RepID=UPI000988665B|nr:hypothetical protein [Caenibacillus caldisaponilyticus]
MAADERLRKAGDDNRYDDAARTLISELLERSETLYKLLQSYETRKADRDAFIRDVQRCIRERQTVIDRVKQAADRAGAAFAERMKNADPAAAEKIVAMERDIPNLLKSVMDDIQSDRQRFHAQRRLSQHYRRPFQNAAREGMFLDKRK